MKQLILLMCLLCVSCASGRVTAFAKKQEVGNYKWALQTFERTIDYPELLKNCGYDRSKLPVPKFVYQEATPMLDENGNMVTLLGHYTQGTIYYSSYRVIWHETFHYITDYYKFTPECLNEFGARMLHDLSIRQLTKGK